MIILISREKRYFVYINHSKKKYCKMPPPGKKKVDLATEPDRVVRPWLINVADEIKYANQLDALNRTLSACPQRNAGCRGMSELENIIPTLKSFRKFTTALNWIERVPVALSTEPVALSTEPVAYTTITSLSVSSPHDNDNDNSNSNCGGGSDINGNKSIEKELGGKEKLSDIKQRNDKNKARPKTATGDFARSLASSSSSSSRDGIPAPATIYANPDKLLQRYCADYNMIMRTNGVVTRSKAKDTIGRSIALEMKKKENKRLALLSEKERLAEAAALRLARVQVAGVDTVSFSNKRSRKKVESVIAIAPHSSHADADATHSSHDDAHASLVKPLFSQSKPQQQRALAPVGMPAAPVPVVAKISSPNVVMNPRNGSKSGDVSSNNNSNSSNNTSSSSSSSSSSSNNNGNNSSNNTGVNLDPIVARHLTSRIADIKKLRNQLNSMTGAYKYLGANNNGNEAPTIA